MSLFIAFPALALLPAVVFFVLFRASHRRVVLVASLAWVAYAGYEYGMYRRWLCTGECNIRIDLFLIYAVLLALSVTAALTAIRSIARRPTAKP